MAAPEYSLGLWGELKQSLAFTWRWFRVLALICFGLSLLFILVVMSFGTVSPHTYTWPGDQIQRAHTIGDTLFYYANHHDGKFPEGHSSTEIFQKVPMTGKTAPIAGQPLKPENVCWDVTSPMDKSASDFLPLVFLTGYKITYAPGGYAVPTVKPYPPFTRRPFHWFDGGASDPAKNPGIAVFYMGGQTSFRHLNFTETKTGPDSLNPKDTIPHFISLRFDSQGTTYRQLDPSGPVP